MSHSYVPQPFLGAAAVLSTAALATSEFWVGEGGTVRWWYPTVAFSLALGAEIYRARPRAVLSAERQGYLVKASFDKAFKTLRDIDASVRINIMQVALRRKRFWWGRCFLFQHQFGFEVTHPDGALVLLDGQGVAGAALSSGTWAIGRRDTNTISIGNGDALSMVDRSMTDAQRKQVEDLSLICCYPIRELRKHGSVIGPSGRVIGIVCIDSRMSAQEWESHGHLQELLETWLPDLALASSYILD